RAARPPSARDRPERLGRLPDEGELLLARELDHPRPPAAARVEQRGEDPPAHAEVGVGHVLRLDRLRQAEREVAELLLGHRTVPGAGRGGTDDGAAYCSAASTTDCATASTAAPQFVQTSFVSLRRRSAPTLAIRAGAMRSRTTSATKSPVAENSWIAARTKSASAAAAR